MSTQAKFGCAFTCALILGVGCSSQPESPAQPAPIVSTPSSENEVNPAITDEVVPPVDDTVETVAPTTPGESPPVEQTEPTLVPDSVEPKPTEIDSPPGQEPQQEETVPPPREPEQEEPVPPPEDPEPSPEETDPPQETTAPVIPPDVPTVVDIGGPVEVGAPKPGLSRIGNVKCKICHKVQFASWAETAHATRTPPLDCEGCHGPGSEYKSKKVMEDPEMARAAGLVTPDRSFCMQCHTGAWTDDLMTRTHAHKVEGP